MATVEKIRKDIEKTKEKISAQQKRLRELEAQLTEEETWRWSAWSRRCAWTTRS